MDASVGKQIGRDIKATAAAISRSINEAYDARQDKSRPLVVVIGENHLIGAHSITALRVFQELNDRFDPEVMACGAEMSYNIVENVVSHVYRKPSLIETFKAAVKRNPILGARLASFCTRDFINTAPASHAVLYHGLTDMGVRIVLSDLPLRLPQTSTDMKKCDLDMASEELRRLLPKLVTWDKATAEKLKFSAVDVPGVEIRNRFMVARADEYIQRNPTKVYIHFVGRFHVNGGLPYPYEDSLLGLYRQRNADVVALKLVGNDESTPDIKSERHISPIYKTDGAVFLGVDSVAETEWLSAVMPAVWTGWSSNYLDQKNRSVEREVFGAYDFQR